MTLERIAELRSVAVRHRDQPRPVQWNGHHSVIAELETFVELCDLAAEALRLRAVVERAALTCQSCGGKGFAGTYNVDCFVCRDLRAALSPRGENEETK